MAEAQATLRNFKKGFETEEKFLFLFEEVICDVVKKELLTLNPKNIFPQRICFNNIDGKNRYGLTQDYYLREDFFRVVIMLTIMNGGNKQEKMYIIKEKNELILKDLINKRFNLFFWSSFFKNCCKDNDKKDGQEKEVDVCFHLYQKGVKKPWYSSSFIRKII